MSADPRLPGVFVRLTSWVKAPAVYAYDPRAKRFADTKLQPRGPLDEPADVEAVEVKVRAADGTLVPLSIIHKRGLKLDGSNPTLIHGYGSYGISQLPFFNPQLLAWYERGGVYAVAHVRGGGEYGEEWHRAGQKETKPNTWRDFISCAEYLVERRYTTPARLAGMGQSAGGILVGRAVTERPDLFGAAVISVGLTDMLRYETTANGVPNVPEFGSVRTPEGFKALHEMSAYHHVKDGAAYPAVLVTTGINDPRVEPWLPAKMAARLQAATSSGRPVLLRVDYNAGHGVGSTRRQFAEELADIMTFLLWQFGDPAFRSPRQP
jgi:prolyl oligopeptidase